MTLVYEDGKVLCEKCNKNEAEELHSCPYQSDVNHDDKTLCNCCDTCQSQCAADI